MENQEILKLTEQFVKEKFYNESSGHDWWHIYRVVTLARNLAVIEGADVFICEMSAMLHDIADEKICKDPDTAMHECKQKLKDLQVSEQVTTHIIEIIGSISYKGGNLPPVRTLEAQVVQDADRLDAIGAIGIARVFTYSGHTSRMIHDPQLLPRENMTLEQYRSSNGTAMMHFHEKLLKLKDLMNTNSGRQLAQSRHQYMMQYVERFYEEWEGFR
jgi:uncharacterized protein